MVDEVDALLDAYPASFGQLLDAAVHRHVPPGFQQGVAGQGEITAVGLDLDESPQNPSTAEDSSSSGGTGGSGSGGSDEAGKQQGPGGQDNITRLKALLSEQQQRKSPQQSGSPAGAGSPAAGTASGSNASLAAAAARLEGLLAAPAATPAGEDAAAAQQSQQDHQDSSSSSSSQAGQQQQSSSSSSSSPSDQQEGDSGNAAVQAAGQVPANDDDPMPKPQVVLVGATVNDDDITLALDRGWVTEPVLVRVGSEGSVPAGLKHRAIVVSQQQQRLGGLVASLRRDLTGALAAADAAAAAAEGAGGNNSGSSDKQQPVRVIIFARDEGEARSAAEPLRAALWGDHMLSVLLPSTGAEPVKALTAFRDRVASLLLATPSAARGLDLPAVSHVYSIGLPQVRVGKRFFCEQEVG